MKQILLNHLQAQRHQQTDALIAIIAYYNILLAKINIIIIIAQLT